MEIEEIKKDKEIAKQEIIQAIEKLTSKHKNVVFEIDIENKTMDYVEKQRNYYVVYVGAKI